MISILVFAAIGVGICVDLFSCYLELKRNRGNGKASGLPGVTLIACYLLPLLLSGRAVFTPFAWFDALILFVFHVLVVLAIPIVDRAWVRGSSNRSG